MPELPARAALAAMARASDAASRLAHGRALGSTWMEAVTGLLEGPDPAGACARAAGLPDVALVEPLPAAAVALLHQGSYPARLLGLLPAALSDLAQSPAPAPGRATLARWLAEAPDQETAVAHVRTRAYLAAARLEVEGAPLEVVGGLLSDLAAAAIDHLLGPLRRQVVVFGMGKLGGRELNFLSDIDLIFVHDDDAAPGPVATALRRLVRDLEGRGPMAPLFHVDLRLRPFGRRGPLSLSLAATESYYERHGQPWERQAWLRARPLAGADELGRTLQARLRPFVYRRSVSRRIFDEISALMARARREAHATRPGEGLDLKHDPGGIRDVEFFVQALQLLHGGRVPTLRTPGTLPALDRLLAAGLVSDREHADLLAGYRFLRRLEHRVQLDRGVPTHTLPDSPEGRALLAARLAAHAPAPEGVLAMEGTRAGLESRLARHRTAVASIAETLHGPSADPQVRGQQDARARALAAVTDPGAPTAVQTRALTTLGLSAPEDAQGTLAHLYARADGPFTARGPAQEGARRLLVACLDSADPDAALARLAELVAARPAHHPLWRLFADDDPAHAEAMRLCAELLGSSEPLARGLMDPRGDDPVELLLGAVSAEELPGPDDLDELLTQIDPAAPPHLRARRLKHRAITRVGLFDLGHRPDPLAVGASLSAVADRVLRELAREVTAPAADATFDLCVVGLGKLGMAAMDYGSDLDLLFVYAPAGPATDETELRPSATRAARELLRRLQGHDHGPPLYEVDMRLRPSGREGLLVSGLSAFARYHRTELPTWERLALLRARPVLELRLGAREGAPGRLTEQIAGSILPGTLWSRPTDRARLARDVRHVLARTEREIAREHGGVVHVKAGPGGILALEMLVGALQLLHGPKDPNLRVRAIPAALSALAAGGHLGPEDAARLGAAYEFMRLLLNRLRLGRLRGLSDPERFSAQAKVVPVLARRMGLADGDALVRALHEHRRAVREALDRSLPAP